MAEFCADFPSAYESVGKARRAVIAFARNWFSGEALDDIESAVGEALANCAEHGHRNGTAIEVRISCDGEVFTVEIKDSGLGFERWDVAEYVAPLANALRGYGTHIMRELMDEIEYSERGTRLRLAKRVASCRDRQADDRRAAQPDDRRASWG